MSKLDDLIKALPKRTNATQYGPVEGYVVNGMRIYKGIPYAAAPKGELRWKPPQPRRPWSETLSCFNIGCVCPQDTKRFPVYGKMDEDCLNLNIWAPENPAKPCPVMVWFHGGGFSTGAGSLPPYDGSYFASLGIVVVTLNYRLGVLGYMAHPELSAESGNGSSGNYGVMDQVFALKWVRENIANFGGDPTNVTIFGESAGGASVVALMSSPLSSGLFHRAIAQSPGHAPYRLRKLAEDNGPFESAQAIGMQFAQKLGLHGARGVIAKMRDLPADELAQLWFNTVQDIWHHTGATGAWMLNHLIIDGHALKEAPGEIFRKGKQHNVPFIVGSNADEGTLFEFLMFGNKPDTSKYHHYLEMAFGKARDKIIERFGSGEGDNTRGPVGNLLGSFFQSGTRRLARSMSAVQPQTYRYLFTMPCRNFLYQIPGIDDWQERFGVYHAAEIAFVFHFMLLPGLNEADRALSGKMAGLWARFAATGDPNGPGLPQWPRYSQADESYLVLEDPISTGKGFRADQCDCIDEVDELTEKDRY
jgi:para-nitrobenzyl esterase